MSAIHPDYPRLFAALDERFEDNDEVVSITEHGMSGGVSGFIYHSEIRKFYFEYENEIDSFNDDMQGSEWMHGWTFNNVQDVIQHCVWMCVESYCLIRFDEIEEAA